MIFIMWRAVARRGVLLGGTTTTTSVRGYWSENEEHALKRAVRKHGIGAWEKMRNDPEFVALRCVTRRQFGARMHALRFFLIAIDSFDDDEYADDEWGPEDLDELLDMDEIDLGEINFDGRAGAD